MSTKPTALPSAAIVSTTPGSDLGDYIFSANPYDAGMPPANTWPTKVDPSRTPLPFADLVDVGGDSPFFVDFGGTELEELPGEWDFKGHPQYVARALKIPYIYYKKSDANPKKGILVRDYFLIGFEGGVAYKK